MKYLIIFVLLACPAGAMVVHVQNTDSNDGLRIVARVYYVTLAGVEVNVVGPEVFVAPNGAGVLTLPDYILVDDMPLPVKFRFWQYFGSSESGSSAWSGGDGLAPLTWVVPGTYLQLRVTNAQDSTTQVMFTGLGTTAEGFAGGVGVEWASLSKAMAAGFATVIVPLSIWVPLWAVRRGIRLGVAP